MNEQTPGAAAAETKMQSQHHLPLSSGSRATVSEAAGWELERARMRKQITDLERIKHDLEDRLFGALKTDATLRYALEEVDHAPSISRGLYSKVLDIACAHIARVKELEAAALGNRTPARQEERQGLHPIMVEALAPFTAHLPRTPASQIEDCPELNLSNYDAEDVARLNDWAIRADAALRASSAPTTKG